MRFTGTARYIATDDLRIGVNAAITLERPLLVKGEPGTGKTVLAAEIAQALGAPLIEWSIILFGAGAVSVKLVSLLAGTATVAVVWWVARRWFGVEAGIAAAVLAALSDAAPDVAAPPYEAKGPGSWPSEGPAGELRKAVERRFEEATGRWRAVTSAAVDAAHTDFKRALVENRPHLRYVRALTEAIVENETKLRAFAER